MDIEQFRRAGYQAIDNICDYYYALRNMSVVPQVEPGYLRKALPSSPPQMGEEFESITQDYHQFIVPGLVNWQHPRFFAYYPNCSTLEALLAEIYANGIGHGPAFNWNVGPACTELEQVMTDWAAKMLGLDSAFYNSSGVGGGTIETTASDATIVVAVAARSRFMRQYPDIPAEKLVIYTTTQTHSLGKKTGLVLGLSVRAIEVEAEDNYALRGMALKHALEEDSRAGLHPFMLIATVGTTSSAAIDNLKEIGPIVAAVPSMWLHIDAAWAGMAMVCPEYRALCHLSDINKYADSFMINFNKWGLVSFAFCALWVREHRNLTRALEVTPEFLRSKHGDAGTVTDYRNWQLGLGKRFRSLSLWFVLRLYGVQGFQRFIRRTIQLSDTFVSLIRESPHFRLVTPPCLALSVFRLEPRSVTSPARSHSLDQLNALNIEFYTRLSARHDVMFTRTELNGMICIRCAVGAQRTEEKDIVYAYEALTEEAIRTLESWNWGSTKVDARL